MRLVLDTGVLVAAFRSDIGASRRLLRSVFDLRIQMLVSVPLLIEYEAVLTRSEHLGAAGLDIAEVNEVLDALAAVATRVILRFLWRPPLKNPADEMVLETAVSGGADRLVTFNQRHLFAAAAKFGIRAVTPSEMWKEMQSYEDK